MLFNKEKRKKTIDELLGGKHDIASRIIQCQNGEICILYIKQLNDIAKLSDDIIKPIMEYMQKNNGIINLTKNDYY